MDPVTQSSLTNNAPAEPRSMSAVDGVVRTPSVPSLHGEHRSNPQIRVTREARLYAISELARRAGVPSDFFQKWKVRISGEATEIEIPNGTRKLIRFPHLSPPLLDNLAEGRFITGRASWMRTPPLGKESVREFVVPYVGGVAGHSPLFVALDQNTVTCTSDLPLSILLTLSRWEELLGGPRDRHGRFMATNSVAWRENFLDRPIIDECALAFEEALQFLFPTWPTQPRELRMMLTHDIDHVGMPFSWRTTLRHTVNHGNVGDSLNDMCAWLPGARPAELRTVQQVVQLSSQRGLASTVYWKASPRSLWDSGYDPRAPKIQRTIGWLRERQVELGIHPGYGTYLCPEKLHREVGIIREVLGNGPLGGRQHYLRWCPESWIHWENCGLTYDSSVGYAERIGFRAGTCIPYQPWLFALNRPAEVLEIPLLVMDRTLLGYMRLTSEQSLDLAEKCVKRCRAVGGVFTLLWHNNTLLDPVYRRTYVKLLESLSGTLKYDWQRDARSRIALSTAH